MRTGPGNRTRRRHGCTPPAESRRPRSGEAEGFSFETPSVEKQCDCAAETVLEDASIRMMPTAGCTSGLGDAGDRNPKG